MPNYIGHIQVERRLASPVLYLYVLVFMGADVSRQDHYSRDGYWYRYNTNLPVNISVTARLNNRTLQAVFNIRRFINRTTQNKPLHVKASTAIIPKATFNVVSSAILLCCYRWWSLWMSKANHIYNCDEDECHLNITSCRTITHIDVWCHEPA